MWTNLTRLKSWFYEEVAKMVKEKLDSKITEDLEKEIIELKELIKSTQQEIFIAFIMRDSGDFNVYLVNNSDFHFYETKVLTGAYMSVDEDLLETGKVVKKKGSLKPRSFIEIDKVIGRSLILHGITLIFTMKMVQW